MVCKDISEGDMMCIETVINRLIVLIGQDNYVLYHHDKTVFIVFNDGLLFVYDKEKEELIDFGNRLYILTKLDNMNRYIVRNTSDKRGVIDDKGEFIVNCEYEILCSHYKNERVLHGTKNVNYEVMIDAVDGRVLVPQGFCSMTELYNYIH